MSDRPKSTQRLGTCPNCKKQFAWNSQGISRPFCSERCRLIDLGDWFDENNKIPDNSPHQPFEPDKDNDG